MGKSNKGLVTIVVILIVIGLIGYIVYDKVLSKDNNEIINDNKVVEDNELIEITLPSGNKININKEYENIFNDSEKLIVKTNDCSTSFIDDSITNNSELTLSELLKASLSEYPDDIYTGKDISVSTTLFDFDNDGVNEIMFSYCESFIILHYYDNKIYAYKLIGYRTNGTWRVNGTSTFSASATNRGTTKYSFNASDLVCNVIAVTGLIIQDL